MISNESQVSGPSQDAGPLMEPEHNKPGVLCGRCDYLNVAEADSCERCGAALYVDCPRCGHRNARIYTRCKQCHRRLRRRLFGHRHSHRRHSFLHKAGWRMLEVLLVLAGLGVVLGILSLLYYFL